MTRIIASPADLAEGAAWLVSVEPRFAHAIDMVGEIPLRRRPEGFAELLRLIVGQQVSLASAAAIWARMEAAGFTDEAAVRGAGEAALCAAGLSRPKARYATAIAAAGVDWASLGGLQEPELRARLIALPGVGPWTVDLYALQCLGHADAFAPGDLALAEATKRLFGHATRPDPKRLGQIAAAWSPWRGVAARLLWAYYSVNTR